MTNPIRLEIDVVYTAELGDVLGLIQSHAGKIDSFEATGPAGGNPCLILSFPSEIHARAFVEEYDGDDGNYDQYVI